MHRASLILMGLDQPCQSSEPPEKNSGADKVAVSQTADTAISEGCLANYLLAFASEK